MRHLIQTVAVVLLVIGAAVLTTTLRAQTPLGREFSEGVRG